MPNINNKPLSESEIREYLKKKSFNFSPSDKGKFVIVQKPRKKGLVTRLYLVNRNITKDGFDIDVVWNPFEYWSVEWYD